MQADSSASIGFLVFELIIAIVYIVAAWKVFTKAGKPGWAVLIPFYNAYVFLKIVGRPGWWLLLFFIPIVNIIISLILALDLAKAFGKGTIFGFLALWLFSFVGYPILAFGSAKYMGSGTTTPTPPPPTTTPPPVQAPPPATPPAAPVA